jgi:GDP/UDP-N,N'-diacetylbacillosamine 2-epimerase (hydrolysing)
MGEREDHIWQVGAPGLDGLHDDAVLPRSQLFGTLQLEPSLPVALLVHHPVAHDMATMANETQVILDALLEAECQIIALKPNSDAGAAGVRKALESASSRFGVRVVTHFPRNQFVSWMSFADLMIGNSSAGIIEAGSFGTPVINIGSRQNMRERNLNVTDVPVADRGLFNVIRGVLARGRFRPENVYGDGASAPRIAALLTTIPLDAASLRKCNAY